MLIGIVGGAGGRPYVALSSSSHSSKNFVFSEKWKSHVGVPLQHYHHPPPREIIAFTSETYKFGSLRCIGFFNYPIKKLEEEKIKKTRNKNGFIWNGLASQNEIRDHSIWRWQ